MGLDVARVNTEAPRRFTTPRYLGRCLTYPRLSGTRTIFARPAAWRNDDTRDVEPRRDASPRERPALARETSLEIANTFRDGIIRRQLPPAAECANRETLHDLVNYIYMYIFVMTERRHKIM